jgi:hypothetical protein
VIVSFCMLYHATLGGGGKGLDLMDCKYVLLLDIQWRSSC